MNYRGLVISAVLLLGLVTGCAFQVTRESAATPTAPDPPTRTLTLSSTPTPVNTSTSTPTLPKELTVCQAEEPNTLFIYGGPSRAAHNVLEAIYDGAIDSRTYRFQPVILKKLPSLDNGDVVVQTVQVKEGDIVVDASGEVLQLGPSVTMLNTRGGEVTFEDRGVITTTQLVVTFTLRSDVTWADGQPLTAHDSRYSYALAAELDDPALQRRYRRTQSYQVTDKQTIVWTGVPGYRDTFYLFNFYHPLPRHVLRGTSLEQLLDTEVARRRPLSWGPFAIEEWVEGDHITLVRNPNYFRLSEGLPHLDRVTFRFVADPQRAIDQLLAGECDVVTQGVIGSVPPASLTEAAEAGRIRLISSPSTEWEHLDFGVQPVTWARRVSFFADVRVRQAVAHCIDRERIASEIFPHDAAVVARSYIGPRHPLHAGDQLYRWKYDPRAGQSLLEEAGWRDEDGDGIREAHDVPNVGSGIAFSVTLLTSEGHPTRERTAGILAENLKACGIGSTVNYLPPAELYADGPDGPLFGRQFDLALFSWLNDFSPPCELYLSTEIPAEENWWTTSNDPGYASEEYDAACQSALRALYGTESYARSHRRAQRIFSRDLPVLPLYFVPKLVAARKGVSGVSLDPSEPTAFWNIETFDVIR